MLLVNIDTLMLHAHFPAFLQEMQPFFDQLRGYRTMTAPAAFDWQGETFHYYPERTKGHFLAVQYALWPTPDSDQAVSLDFRFYTQPLKEASHQWPVEITFHSTILWVIPFAELWTLVHRLLRTFVTDPAVLYDENGESLVQFRISRVDLALDTDELPFAQVDNAQFVTRAKRRVQYGLQANWEDDETLLQETVVANYRQGAALTGFSFGKGEIMIRIYNKWNEISRNASYKHDKRFFAALWAQQGWAQTQDVWRTELQLRRPALVELALPDGRTLRHLPIPEALQALPSFLPYFLQDWLSLRLPNEEKNKWRWPLHPLWAQMVAHASGQALAGTRQLLPPQFNAQVLARTIMGYLASFALAVGEWEPTFFASLPDHLAHAIHRQPEDVWAMIQAAMEKKAEKYHIALPGTFANDTASHDLIDDPRGGHP
jgi:hypothetical protein